LINLLALFANNILPILMATAIGYIASRSLKFDPKSITQTAFYIFSPALLFTLLTKNPLQGREAFLSSALILISFIILGFSAWSIGKLLHLERKLLAALILVVTFGNMGNYGLALVSFAFGDEALAFASLLFVIESICVHSIGVLIASMGKFNFWQAMKGLVRVPSIYAVIFALLINTFDWTIPLPIDRTITTLSNASIPVMMVILGIQLEHSDGLEHLPVLGVASLLRFGGSVLIAFILSSFFNLKGSALQASVIQLAMPSAVINTIIANQFDAHPSFVTNAVLITTLISPFVLTPVLYFLGA